MARRTSTTRARPPSACASPPRPSVGPPAMPVSSRPPTRPPTSGRGHRCPSRSGMTSRAPKWSCGTPQGVGARTSGACCATPAVGAQYSGPCPLRQVARLADPTGHGAAGTRRAGPRAGARGCTAPRRRPGGSRCPVGAEPVDQTAAQLPARYTPFQLPVSGTWCSGREEAVFLGVLVVVGRAAAWRDSSPAARAIAVLWVRSHVSRLPV